MNVSHARLTDNQKRVLTKILAAPTPKVAGQEISDDENLVAARDLSARMGLLTFVNNQAELTDFGMEMLKDEALVDETGQLTQDGQAFAYTTPTGKSDEQKPTPGPKETLPFAPSPSPGLGGPGLGGPRLGGPSPFESIALNPVKLKFLKELLSL